MMIDEKKLIEEIANFKRCQKSENCDYLTGYISALSAVEGMIAEQPKMGEWIPCSEWLPEEPLFADEGYIVQQKRVREPFTLYWDGEKWTDANGDEEDDIIAWMPLPEPYNPNKENI